MPCKNNSITWKHEVERVIIFVGLPWPQLGNKTRHIWKKLGMFWQMSYSHTRPGGKTYPIPRNRRRSRRVACTFRGWKNIWAINILWLRNDSIFKNYEWHFSLSSFFSPCYFSPRRGCPRVVKFCTGSKLTKILGFQPKKIPRNPPSAGAELCQA